MFVDIVAKVSTFASKWMRQLYI